MAFFKPAWSSVTVRCTPCSPRLFSPKRKFFQLLVLSRSASSTPRICRRPSQSTPIATNTARLHITPASRTRS